MMDFCTDCGPIILNFDALLSKIFIYDRGLAVNAIYDFYRASACTACRPRYCFVISVRPSVRPSVQCRYYIWTNVYSFWHSGRIWAFL